MTIVRRLSDAEIARARKVIENQAATVPPDGDLSPAGSLRRAKGVRTATGLPAVQESDRPLGFPSLSPWADQ